MTSGLQWLYERYRTATKPSLYAPKNKPGEWLEVSPRTPEAGFIQEAAGNMDTSTITGLILALKYLAGSPLNQMLGVASDKDVRITFFRHGNATKRLFVRFFAASPGKKRGAPGTSRFDLPPINSAGTQTDLLNTGAENPSSVSFRVGPNETQFTSATETEPFWDPLENSHVSDGRTVSEEQPGPDFSTLFDVEDFDRFLADGHAEEGSEIGRFVREAIDEARAMIEGEEAPDPSILVRSVVERLEQAQAYPPILEDDAPEPQNWHTASRQVVETTLTICQENRAKKGQLVILCPSPAGGKTHAMVEAARADRAAGKRVGYAVLAKGNLMEEARDRLTGGDKHLVQLHVIEGRHAGNCVEYESVQQAAALGYYPGSQVCPKCDKYPSLSNPFSSLDRNATCEYYASRLRAIRDSGNARLYNNPMVRPYPLILTTHAGMATGTAMHARGQKTFRSLPSLWDFDSIFIDEDPTGALEQVFEIKEQQLVYEWKDPTTKRPDAHTQMTRVLSGMFVIARAQRNVAWKSGFRSTVHTRDHGSTYASNDLIDLLKESARNLGYDLEEVLAQLLTESEVKSPKRGELLSIRPEVAAKKYPHRYLIAIGEAVRQEILARKNAPEEGAGLDLAYRVHADLTLDPDSNPATAGITHGTITLTITTPFVASEANVTIGDAYASIGHYEELFRRYRRHGDVRVVNHRIEWPRSSVLIRVPTRCTSGEFPTDASFHAHCDSAILPLLELEQGRRVLLYTHKGSRDLLDTWIRPKAEELGLELYAIEHWGSGRGKDIYRDFDTFIAATEYLPNIYGLVHEANGRMAQSNALSPRIYFWNVGQKRQSGGNLTDAITSGDPALATVFQRRAIDELAQAVHRIRPAKPRPCERCGKLLDDPRVCQACGARQPLARWQKRCWVLGYHVPMSPELLAATCTVKLDEEKMELERDGLDHRGRGARVKVHAELGLLSFVSKREVATAMGDVFSATGCWCPVFAHTLQGVPLGDVLSRVLHRVSFGPDVDVARQPFGEPCSSDGSASFSRGPDVASDVPPFRFESNRLVDRIYSPPGDWREISDRIVRLPMYRAGRDMFLEAVSKSGRPPLHRRIKRPWMAAKSPGVECIGDPGRLEKIIDYYGPNPPKPPF